MQEMATTSINTSYPSPTQQAETTSPSRGTRLRALSYLRNYTHNHLLSRDAHSSSSSRPSIARATSYPSPEPSDRAYGTASATPPETPTSPQNPTAEPSIPSLSGQDTTNSAAGGLPALEDPSGASRVAPQPTTTTSSATGLSANSSSNPAPMARTRSATVTGAPNAPSSETADLTAQNEQHAMPHQLPSIRFTAHQDPRASRPSLVFSPVARILPNETEIIKVGRYSERDAQTQVAANVPSAAPVGFKSKVVSRRHCEFWSSGGHWFIRDVKSSSGTFLNHIRLSSPGTESRPFPVNDGDIVQLGIDFKGGEEMIFRCVKIRVELNKGWQNGPTSFNVRSHKRLRELNSLGTPSSGGSSQDCSICLGPIAPCQSLFVAPCSHTWHYKCIRVIINGPHWPHFICPNCRTVADLEAEPESHADGEWEQVEAGEDEATTEAAVPAETGQTPRQRRQPNTSEETDVPPQVILEEFDQDQSMPSDEAAESSDDQVADAIDQLHIHDSSSGNTPARSVPSSNATVAPVDIANRKTSGLSAGSSRSDRNGVRTPSPSGLPSSLSGPMTPRNDAGPFVFDGSAGRSPDGRLAAIGTLNLGAAVDSATEHDVDSEAA